MEDLIDKTLKQIKEDKIKPVSSWRMAWHNYLFWGTFVLMLFFSGISLAFIIQLSFALDWDLLSLVNKNRLVFFVQALPVFWIFLLLVFSVLSFINFRYTKTGYRYSNRRVIGVIFGLSLGLGTLAYALEADKKLDQALVQTIPQYHRLDSLKEGFWTQPERGLLGGEIIEVQGNAIELRGFDGIDWMVLADENTRIRPLVVIEKRRIIKVVGKREMDYIFHAQEIRPWEGMNRFMGR